MATSVNPNDINYGDAGFAQAVFVVKMQPNYSLGGSAVTDGNGDFSRWVDILNFANITDASGHSALAPGMDPQFANILEQANEALPEYFYSRGKCRDTTIGGNDAINCYPQFNETDDVAEHPFLSIDPNDPQSGMGRVYSDVYDDQQQIMYMCFGVPQFNNLTYFYGNAVHPILAQIMNNGGNISGSNLGSLFGDLVGIAIALPAVPLVWLYNLVQGLSQVNITKYYDFKSAMPLYYRIVNSTLIHLSTNLGLNQDDYYFNSGITGSTSGGIYDGTFLEANATPQAVKGAQPGLPLVFQKNGFDMYKINLVKDKYIFGAANVEAQTTLADGILLDPANNQGGIDVGYSSSTFAENTILTAKAQIYDANLFIGFKVEKGIDTSESFSNEVGQSSIAQTVNSTVSSTMDKRFSFMGGNVLPGMQSFMQAVGGVLTGIATDTGVVGGATAILAGQGMVDFPEVWKDSSMSKNYSFTMSLRSPYGDPVSIMQNLYFPLALILAGALPRAAGQASYLSPFIIRAYCKGMFAVPMGMITSLTVKRGADQYGWSTARLPTCLEISFEIKDLSSAMYLGINDDGSKDALSAFLQIFSTNSNWQEYLMTLSGMGLKERISFYKRMRRKVMYFMAQDFDSKLSGAFWGNLVTNNFIGRGLSVFAPDTRLPTN